MQSSRELFRDGIMPAFARRWLARYALQPVTSRTSRGKGNEVLGSKSVHANKAT